MRRRPQPTLSLVLSLVLMIFAICQAQARTQLPGATLSRAAPATHLHDMSSNILDAAPSTPLVDCHGDCLKQPSHADAGVADQRPDASPGLLAVLPAVPSLASALSRALAYHPPSARDADPPPVLRFQRFLN